MAMRMRNVKVNAFSRHLLLRELCVECKLRKLPVMASNLKNWNLNLVSSLNWFDENLTHIRMDAGAGALVLCLLE
jgi:hypothetical protein